MKIKAKPKPRFYFKLNCCIIFDAVLRIKETTGSCAHTQRNIFTFLSNSNSKWSFKEATAMILVQLEDCFHLAIVISVDVVFHNQIERDVKVHKYNLF
uniref:Uncharacterized protein n=1 Tax=Glossina palpalis gambiensis TaxID=67801 RepID=A0A1B0BXR1_9MUSC